jgi:hypothetical protein
VAVSLRLLRALTDIAIATPDPDYHLVLAERGRRIVAGCSEKFSQDEMIQIHERLTALEAFILVPRTPA